MPDTPVTSPAPAWIRGAARSSLCLPLTAGNTTEHPWSPHPEQTWSTCEWAQCTAMTLPRCPAPWKISVKGMVAWAENGPTHQCQLLSHSQEKQPKLSVDSTATPLPCHPLMAPCHQPSHCSGLCGPEDGAEHLSHGCCHLLEETHHVWSWWGADSSSGPRCIQCLRCRTAGMWVCSESPSEMDPPPCRAPPLTLAWPPALDPIPSVAAGCL